MLPEAPTPEGEDRPPEAPVPVAGRLILPLPEAPTPLVPEPCRLEPEVVPAPLVPEEPEVWARAAAARKQTAIDPIAVFTVFFMRLHPFAWFIGTLLSSWISPFSQGRDKGRALNGGLTCRYAKFPPNLSA